MTATIHRRSGKPISFRLETGKKEKDASPLTGCHSCAGLPHPRPPGLPAAPGEHLGSSESLPSCFWLLCEGGELASSPPVPWARLLVRRKRAAGHRHARGPFHAMSVREGHRHGSGVTVPLRYQSVSPICESYTPRVASSCSQDASRV